MTFSFNCCVHVNAWTHFSAHSYFVKEVKSQACDTVQLSSVSPEFLGFPADLEVLAHLEDPG